jgi:hypothetical protein
MGFKGTVSADIIFYFGASDMKLVLSVCKFFKLLFYFAGRYSRTVEFLFTFGNPLLTD